MNRRELIWVTLGVGVTLVLFTSGRRSESARPTATEPPERAVAKLAIQPDRRAARPPHPVAAVRNDLFALLAEPDAQRRVAALHAWFRTNLPEHLPDLKQLFAGIHDQQNADLFTAFQVFLEEWANLDGAAAYDFVHQLPLRNGSDAFAQPAIRGWLRQDFNGLWNHLLQQQPLLAQDDDRARWATTYFTEAFIDLDPERFFTWADTVDKQANARLFEEIARTVAHYASDATIDQVAGWIRQHEDSFDASETMTAFARRYAEMKPEQAAAWVASLESPEHRGAASVQVANRLGSHNAALGVQWLSHDAVYHALNSAPAQWRIGEESATAYDAAVAAFLTTLARQHGSDPGILKTVMESIASVENDRVRQHLTERLEEVRITYFGGAGQ